MLGTVSMYDRTRGFGFLIPDDESLPDFFICAKFIAAEKCRRFLMPGWRVEFDPIDIDDRPQARSVKIIARTIAIQRSALAPREGGHE